MVLSKKFELAGSKFIQTLHQELVIFKLFFVSVLIEDYRNGLCSNVAYVCRNRRKVNANSENSPIFLLLDLLAYVFLFVLPIRQLDQPKKLTLLQTEIFLRFRSLKTEPSLLKFHTPAINSPEFNVWPKVFFRSSHPLSIGKLIAIIPFEPQHMHDSGV